MSEKSVFPETLSPEITSQSFPVSCFWSRSFVAPPEVKFDTFGSSETQGRKITIKICFCYSYQYIIEILSSK